MQHPDLLALLRVGARGRRAFGLLYIDNAWIESGERELAAFVCLVIHGEHDVVLSISIVIDGSTGLGGKFASSREVAGHVFEVCNGLACNLLDGHDRLGAVVAREDGDTVIVDDDVATRSGCHFLVAGGVSTAAFERTRNFAVGLLCACGLEGAAAGVFAFDEGVCPGTCVLGEIALDEVS